MIDAQKQLTEVFFSSPEILFDDEDKFVIMSDCHRGDASWADTFAKNQNIYFHALYHYFTEGFTYIELGDGDELWKNKSMNDIKENHADIFWLLSNFYKQGRLYMVFGNHDMSKKDPAFNKRYLSTYYDEREKCSCPLFPGIDVTEGLVLHHRKYHKSIFLVHGHQGDILNDKLWKLGRFLVRYFWRPLELFGINDPTGAAKNYTKKIETEDKLIKWSTDKDQIVIAGHTHRPVYPQPGESLYFNDGSCVHPRCITAIEIENGNLTLVKWNIDTRTDGSLFIDREVLAGPNSLQEYYEGARRSTIHSNRL